MTRGLPILSLGGFLSLFALPLPETRHQSVMEWTWHFTYKHILAPLYTGQVTENVSITNEVLFMCTQSTEMTVIL